MIKIQSTLSWLSLFTILILCILYCIPNQRIEIPVYDRVETMNCNISNLETLKKTALVYTWVNGSEKCYNKRRTDIGLSPGGTSRDKQIGELQYSIRSVIKFLPWLEGPIYIVTPGQIPTWLDINNPRIQVIDQDELFPDKSKNPNFNTNAIEQFLYKIPGLTETFIHMNDDYLFTKYTPPRKLFNCDGGPRFFVEINHIRHVKATKDNPWLASVRNTVQLTDKTYGGEHVYNFVKHAPFVYRRQTFEFLHQQFSKELKKTAQHKTRNFEDLNIPLLHHIVMVEEASGLFNIPVEFNSLQENDDWVFILLKDDNRKELNTTFQNILNKKVEQTFVALNDEYSSKETALLVQNFYQQFLPEIPPHELPNGKQYSRASNRDEITCEVIPGLLTLPPEVPLKKFKKIDKIIDESSLYSKFPWTTNTLAKYCGLLLGISSVVYLSLFLPYDRSQRKFIKEIGISSIKNSIHNE